MTSRVFSYVYRVSLLLPFLYLDDEMCPSCKSLVDIPYNGKKTSATLKKKLPNLVDRCVSYIALIAGIHDFSIEYRLLLYIVPLIPSNYGRNHAPRSLYETL